MRAQVLGVRLFAATVLRPRSRAIRRNRHAKLQATRSARPGPGFASGRVRLRPAATCHRRASRHTARVSESFHMTPDAFRRHGHEVVEWVAAYMERVERAPGRVGRPARRDPRRAAPSGTGGARPFAALLGDLDEVVLPGITHWQAPGWFAYFPANTSGAVDSRGAGVGRSWRAGDAVVVEPGADRDRGARARLARRPARPARALQDIVRPGGGVIQMSASDSTHLMHVVARERDARRRADDRLVAYALLPGALVRRARRARRRLRARASARRRRRLRAASGRVAGRHRSGSRGRPRADDRDERDRDHGHAAQSTPSEISPTSRTRTACGSTSTLPGRARRCSARSTAGIRRASSASTATRSTRTSGCSPTSTATCCGWPTARR